MKSGKYTKNKALRGTKRMLVLMLSLIVLGISIGATLAYLNDKSDPLVNKFIPAEVQIEIQEEFNNSIKTNVCVENKNLDGKGINAFIRAKIVVTWQDGNGNVWDEAPDTEDYYLNTGDDWEEIGGYYYYKTAVAPGALTTELIRSAGLNPNANVPQGYDLCIDVLASGIQSTPTSAVLERWGFVPGTSSGT